jgi:hypothetical protein
MSKIKKLEMNFKDLPFSRIFEICFFLFYFLWIYFFAEGFVFCAFGFLLTKGKIFLKKLFDFSIVEHSKTKKKICYFA